MLWVNLVSISASLSLGGLINQPTIAAPLPAPDRTSDLITTSPDPASTSAPDSGAIQSPANSSPASPSLGVVTSVSQLSDVQPTDWAFQALQSLVERYGCIAGYPDGTYKGGRALSRYEFAAGLNACMDRVNELIAAGTADLVTKDDLATLKALQDQFASELATLRGQVDGLTARVDTLEAQQFSTTTKLQGQVIFNLSSAYGAYPGPRSGTSPTGTSGTTPGRDAQIVFNNRVRLNLITSFSGKDMLITGLQSFNFGGGIANPTGSLAGTLGYGDPAFGTASNVSLAYAPLFGTTDPRTLGTSAGANGGVGLYKLLYIFPVTNKLTAFVGTGAEVDDAFPTIVPFYGEGNEAVSRFAQMNPVLRVSGGTSGIGLASAGGIIWNISDAVDLRALYGSVNANLPSNNGFPGTPLGAGLFGGSYVAAAQLTLKPSSSWDLALNYAHSYHQINITGDGSAASAIGVIPGVPLTTPVSMDSFGVTTAYRFSPQVSLSGFFFYSTIKAEAGFSAGTDLLSYMVGLHVKDALRKGNTFGVLFGQPPARTSTSGIASAVPENAKPYHLETYYKFQVNDNISITPGFFVVFNPEGYSGNPTAYVPVIRTTFSF